MLGLAINIWRAALSGGTGGDTTPGGAVDVILRSGGSAGGILKAGSTDYIKKAG